MAMITGSVGGGSMGYEFNHLRLTAGETKFLEGWHGQLEDVNDPYVIISQKTNSNDASCQTERLNRKAIETLSSGPLCRTMLDMSDNGISPRYRFYIERHLIPGANTIAPRLLGTEIKPIQGSIKEYNERPVNGDVEIKLTQEFNDAQAYLDAGFNPEWDEVDLTSDSGKNAFLKDIEILNVSEGMLKSRLKHLQDAPFNVGVAMTQGDRDSMEDTQLTCAIDVVDGAAVYKIPLYAVFDGHDGSECAKYLHANLQNYLKEKFDEAFEKYPQPGKDRTIAIFNILKLAFVELGRKYREFADDSNWTGRSTAILGVTIDGNFWVSNVGDSRAILCSGGKAVALSQDAKPGMFKFIKGIIKRLGKVQFFDGNLRTQWGLAMGRAVGHGEEPGKNRFSERDVGVNSRAKITRIATKDLENDATVVFASDGLWDRASSRQVAKTVFELSKNGSACAQIAEHLVKRAYVAESHDNISVIAVKLT